MNPALTPQFHPHPHHLHPHIHLGPRNRQSFLGSYQGVVHPTPQPIPQSNLPLARPQISQSQFVAPRAFPSYVSQPQPQPQVYFGQSQIRAVPQYVSQPPQLANSQIRGPLAAPSVVLGQSQAPLYSSQFISQQPQPQPLLAQSQVVDSRVVQTGEVIRGESSIVEYVPFERTYYEEMEVEKVEYVPVEKRYTDYYAIENQVEYIPETTYETIRELVPQQKTNYRTQQKVTYIPQVKTDMITTNRVQETTEYVAQEKHVIIYPEFEGQYIQEAETSGKVKVSSGLVNSGVAYAQNWGTSYAGERENAASPWGKSPASIQEKYLLKKLEKDLKRLEAETKVERSHSESPGKKKKERHPKQEEDRHLEPDVLGEDRKAQILEEGHVEDEPAREYCEPEREMEGNHDHEESH